MKFMTSSDMMHWEELAAEVRLVISNLQWGYLKFNPEKFGEGHKLAEELAANIEKFQRDDFCYSSEENYKPAHVMWLYDFFTKARCFGALDGVLHDKTYEDRIQELEQDNKRLTELLATVVKSDESKSKGFEAVQ